MNVRAGWGTPGCLARRCGGAWQHHARCGVNAMAHGGRLGSNGCVSSALDGIPEADQEALRERIDKGLELESAEMPDMLERMANAQAQSEVFGEYVDWRYENPSDDLMTELLNAEYEDVDGERKKLTREEVLNYINLLSGAGNETTTRLIGWTGKTLAEHPDQLRMVAEDRELVPKVIEETLRYEAPSPVQSRFVMHDVELHGQTVPEGSAMVVINGSGNRDDRKFDDGDSFDIDPQDRPPPVLRLRHPLLPGRRPGPHGGPHRPRRGAAALPGRLGGRLGQRQAGAHVHRPRVADAPGGHQVSGAAHRRRRRVERARPVDRHRSRPARRTRSRCWPAARTASSAPPRRPATASVPIVCDVCDEASVDAAIAAAAEHLGGIDGLVYATGIGELATLMDHDVERWHRAFDTNVIGAWQVTRAAIPHLAESQGAAAYLSSVSASLTPPWPGLGSYAVSKAALDKLVEAWRAEHPQIGFTRVVVGDCAGGEGESLTEFANGWDRDAAADFVTEWYTRKYITGTLMDVAELVGTVDFVRALRLQRLHPERHGRPAATGPLRSEP